MREQKFREETEEREAKLLLALKEARPVVPQTVHLTGTKLPRLTEVEDVTTFIELLEAAMVDNQIPPDQWKAKVHATLDTATKLKVRDTITNPDSTYAELKEALLGCGNLSFSHASESLMTSERGDITTVPIRQALQKYQRILERLTSEALTIKEACGYIAVAVARFNTNQDLKTYLDMKGDFTKDLFCRNVEEWLATKHAGTKWSSRSDKPFASYRQTTGRPSQQGKQKGESYFCGKPGHFAQECRSRLFKERQPQPAAVPPPQTTKKEPVAPGQPGRSMADVTCFRCRQQGHISPNCPKKTSKVKRVKVREDQIESLRRNEVFGAVGPHRMLVTCDTGAEVTVVPEEAVEQDQLSGETCELRSFNDGKSTGKRCVVQISVDGVVFTKEAVTQPGESLGWSVCLSLDLTIPSEREFLVQQMTRRAEMTQEEVLYIPPEVREGFLVSGISVKEARVVKVRKTQVKGAEVTKEVPVLAAIAEAQQVEVEKSTPPKVEEVAVDSAAKEPLQPATAEAQLGDSNKEEDMDAVEVAEKAEGQSGVRLVMEEAEGVASGDRANIEGAKELPVETIREGMPREVMAAETRSDKSLLAILQLAEMDKEGYHLMHGLVFRTRLDTFGMPIEELCIPTSFRQRCLTALHTSFGHQGRNRMVALLRPHFYWPCMAKDCVNFVKACDKCQEMDKSIPRPPRMTERPIVTRPFSDVSINIVGPFPTAKGRFHFMLTCIDTASRWPEALPIRTITSRVVIGCLTTIFTRLGFPEKLTSDNGTQFTSKSFTKWLRDKGIAYARSTPYHPQGNGIVEHLHRTFNAVIGKTIKSKGDWTEVLPMALFFLRCTPTSSTRMSPFLLTHGLEPTTPIQLLYQSWVNTELGGVDLSQWVLDNVDRVESAREQATLNFIENSRTRALQYNKRAKDRDFKVGDRVWVRRPGLDHKLRESWVSPGTILKVNSPISFRVQTPERIVPTINIQQLKLAETEVVKKITMVVEDIDNDELANTFASAKVQEQALTGEQQAQLDQVLGSYTEFLTKNPGLTKLVQFEIDTGDAEPIYQRPYSTPIETECRPGNYLAA